MSSGVASIFLWLIAFSFLGAVEATEFYSFVDENGVIHLTDKPKDARYRPVRFTTSAKKKTSLKRWPTIQRTQPSKQKPVVNTVSAKKPEKMGKDLPKKTGRDLSKRRYHTFKAIISDAARRYGLNSALLRSVIQAESSFNPQAVSPKGAVGLMQLMPATARMYGAFDSTDPKANIHAGARFLAALLKRFDNDLELSLAAYNAGPTAVTQYGRAIPPYPETQKYVTRVLRYYQEYRQAM